MLMNIIYLYKYVHTPCAHENIPFASLCVNANGRNKPFKIKKNVNEILEFIIYIHNFTLVKF